MGADIIRIDRKGSNVQANKNKFNVMNRNRRSVAIDLKNPTGVKLTDIFKTKSRDEWCANMEGSDVCFAPVLSMSEVADHPHNKARKSFIEVDGILQTAPAPKFSRTQPDLPTPPPIIGEHNESALKDWGFSEHEIDELKRSAAI